MESLLMIPGVSLMVFADDTKSKSYLLVSAYWAQTKNFTEINTFNPHNNPTL